MQSLFHPSEFLLEHIFYLTFELLFVSLDFRKNCWANSSEEMFKCFCISNFTLLCCSIWKGANIIWILHVVFSIDKHFISLIYYLLPLPLFSFHLLRIYNNCCCWHVIEMVYVSLPLDWRSILIYTYIFFLSKHISRSRVC